MTTMLAFFAAGLAVLSLPIAAGLAIRFRHDALEIKSLREELIDRTSQLYELRDKRPQNGQIEACIEGETFVFRWHLGEGRELIHAALLPLANEDVMGWRQAVSIAGVVRWIENQHSILEGK